MFSLLKTWAINSRPQLLRGCVNYDDSTITLSWNSIEDNCNSFNTIRVYGNENGGNFNLLATISDKQILEYPHYIENLNVNRRYYIVLNYGCNGIDSFVSDTISPDLTYPQNLELDSLSYDLVTQDIVAGWKKNPSKDTRGYQIYNFSSGNGDSIGFTSNTHYTVSLYPATRFPVVIATLDSCNLSSTLSSPHQVMFLAGSLDTCARAISLSWTRYIGWNTVDSQSIYLKTNNLNYIKIATVSGTITNYTYTNINLGDTLHFYVRAHTKNNVSSSSNTTSFRTRKLETPSVFYLSNVSVTNNETSIDVYINNTVDQKEILVYKAEGQKKLIPFTYLLIDANTTDYSITDKNVSVNQHHYSYKLKLINKCNDTISTSDINTSILLVLDSNLRFNRYRGWHGEIDYYKIENSKDGFTWNTLITTNDSIYHIKNPEGCYLTTAYEKNNPYNTNKTSISNKVCVQDSMQAFIPTAVNLNSSNNTFKIYGLGINHSESTYSIYNRWGEQLVEANTDSTWNCEYKNEAIPSGVYIYIIHLKGNNGEQQSLKGTLYVIK